jgi:hypothetical protein
MSKDVFDYYGEDGIDSWVSVYDPTYGFPSYYGAPIECNVFTAKGRPVRGIDFYNGGVDVICADSIDARGDINLNGLGYEIADAVMFTQYFVKGLLAFPPDCPLCIPPTYATQGAIAASDVNADGIPLSVADLVYLIRVVVGDAQPYDKVSVANANWSNDGGIYSVDAEMGAVAVVVAGNQTPKNLSSAMMDYAYDQSANITRIIIRPDFEHGSMTGFTGNFLEVSGDMVSIEMATVLGQPVAAKLVPRAYALSQNYPNPFNPSTTIEFALPKAGDYSLTIYNIQGQSVTTFNGTAQEAGFFSVEWDASSVASGVYFYKLTSGEFSNVKKMMLVK